MQLTLIIPELLWPEPQSHPVLEKNSCPGLAAILGRARLTRTPRHSLEDTLAQSFGISSGTTPVGLAPYRLLGEENSPAVPGKTWLCADPVSLQFHHDRIVVGDSAFLDLTPEEIEALLHTLNTEFAHLGRFHAPHPERWYLEALHSTDMPLLPPLSIATGRQFSSQIPESPQLSRLLNELQMVLHQHPVNQARENQGLPTINSLWLWGEGSIPSTPELPTKLHGVWSDHPLAKGLGCHLGLPIHPSPAGLRELLAALPGNGFSHVLASCENLVAPSLLEDQDTWKKQLQQMDTDWFSPLYQQIGGAITQLELVSPDNYGTQTWNLTPRDRWKFWKTACSPLTLAHNLAESAKNASHD